MRRSAALLAILLGCSSPRAQVEAADQALFQGDLGPWEALCSPDYSDALGKKAELMRDLERLSKMTTAFTVKSRDVEELGGGAEGRRTLQATLELSFSSSTLGEWRWTGPRSLELDGGKVRSGAFTDLRDLIDLFDRRRRALEANDAEAIGALLHPEYKDGDHDREATVARLREDLLGAKIRLEPLSYWAEDRGLQTHVDERYRLTIGEVSRAAVARFSLRKAAGRWRIEGGLYRD
ncbi:MAG: nuclear transport factor 2 family protein [Myxococcota bacterium]